jgi:hypothetical protein
MRHLNHITVLTRGLATALAALALEAAAQVPANMPNPEKADDQAKRLAESPFRRILEAGRVEVKLRRKAVSLAEAFDAVNNRRIVQAADYWIGRNPAFADTDMRFDVIFLAPWTWPRHVINAFDASP